MSSQTLTTIAERLGEELILADRDDLPALSGLHTLCAQLAEAARDAGADTYADTVDRVGAFLEAIILDEVSNRDEAFGELTAAVTALHAMARDDLTAEKADLAARFRPSVPENGASTPAETSAAPAPAAEAPAQEPDSADSEMPIVDEDILNEFLARQPGVLEELEGYLLTLDSGDDPEAFGAVKRIIHTIKGEAGLLELRALADACHRVENCLQQNGYPYPTDGLLAFKDWMAGAVELYTARTLAPPPDSTMYALFEGVAPDAATAASSAVEPVNEPAAAPVEEETPLPPVDAAPVSEAPAPEGADSSTAMEVDEELFGDFVNEAIEHLDNADVHLLTIETEPQNEDALSAVFRAFHTIKGTAGYIGLREIQDLSHEAENLLDKARKHELELVGPAIDAVFDSVDMLKKMVSAVNEAICSGMSPPSMEALPALIEVIRAIAAGEIPPPARLGEILVSRGRVPEEAVDKALQDQAQHPEKKLGAALIETGAATPKEVAQALRQQQSQRQARTAAQVHEPVKVDAERLDQLIDMIGELVIAESMVSGAEEIRRINSSKFSTHMRQLDKITRELQEVGMSLRMVPIRATFQKMARLVRDLGHKSGKQVEFVMSGEDTELDKSVVDKIGDPLVHMVRNSVDHGLEPTPEERTAAGKPPVGRVELRAFHKGGNIYIEIEDDGRGLDLERIREKAIERGLITEHDNLSERELCGLIFEAGFSTAKQVTDVSGRGVGMDVVRRNIEALRGQIEVHSEKGKGTRVSLKLPLTLAIIDGMVVRVGRERYVIPTLSITRSVRPRPDELPTVVERGEMMKEQGNLIPLMRLSRLFGIEDTVTDPTQGLVVVVEDDGKKAGLLTDELLGQQQIVIKSLGSVMKRARGVAGGAIMSDGQVGLILDVGGVIKLANSNPHPDGRNEEAGAFSAVE